MVANVRTSARPSRRYGARLPVPAADAGYHASTSTFRGSPDPDNVSTRALSVSRQVVVPTGNLPVGAGSSNGAGAIAADLTAATGTLTSVANAVTQMPAL